MASPNIQFLGYQPVQSLVDYLQSACAFIFAAEEDFGIAPLEAQACGTPVIAYGRGGLTETIRAAENDPQKTGVFFYEQNASAIQVAVDQFLKQGPDSFKPEACRENALRFSPGVFSDKFSQFINHEWQRFESK
jgi:glycosyltransferase involved in cell wall biosynthesis